MPPSKPSSLASAPTNCAGRQRSSKPPGHSFSDVARKVVSIINLASVAALEEMVGRPVDPLRFRGNLYVRGWPAWSELDLVGRDIAVGSARGRRSSSASCVAPRPTSNPVTGIRDLNIPQTLMRSSAMPIAASMPRSPRPATSRRGRSRSAWCGADAMQVLVVGAGVVGLAIARAGGARRPRRHRRRGGRPYRQRHLLAQQRGHPRRHLLSDRLAARAPLRPLAAHALRLLRFARRPATARSASSSSSAATRIGRRSKSSTPRRSATASKACGCSKAPRRCGWSRRSPASPRSIRRRPGIIDSHRYMLALQGDLEDRGRRARPQHAGRRHRAGGGRLRRSFRRARAGHRSASMPSSIPPGTARRRWRARPKAIRPSGCRRTVLAKGNYFAYTGRPVVHPPDLSGAGAGRARHPCHARPRRPHAVRPRRRMDRPITITPSIRAAPRSFYTAIRTYWPGLPGRFAAAPTMPASGRSSPDPASRLPIS